MNAVTSLCCIKYLKACNHSVAILVYWGTLCHLEVFAALGNCQISEMFPHVEFRLTLLSIKFNAHSVLKETCAWVNLLTKFNWKRFDHCYWTNSASEVNVLYLAVVCEKILQQETDKPEENHTLQCVASSSTYSKI